jgi:hypothetical protein
LREGEARWARADLREGEARDTRADLREGEARWARADLRDLNNKLRTPDGCRGDSSREESSTGTDSTGA